MISGNDAATALNVNVNADANADATAATAAATAVNTTVATAGQGGFHARRGDTAVRADAHASSCASAGSLTRGGGRCHALLAAVALALAARLATAMAALGRAGLGRSGGGWARGAAGGLAVCALAFLASCNAGGPLTPAWQQDSNLYYQGTAARQAQTSTTPHGVARVIYAQPDHLHRLLEKQGDVADAQHGPARMGDGTLDLGVQDAVTGRWLGSYLCGGHLFVAALPHQAYRLVLKNRTPMPLQVGVGVDGRDLETGASASLRRGQLRIPARGTLTLDHGPGGPLLFRAVQDDMVLYDMSPKGRPGIVQVAAYLSADAPSVGPQKMRPSQVLPLSLFPIGAPEQYR